MVVSYFVKLQSPKRADRNGYRLITHSFDTRFYTSLSIGLYLFSVMFLYLVLFLNMIYMKFYLSPLLLNLIYDFCFSLLLFILTICYSFRISKFSFIPHYTFSSYNKDDYSFALLSVTIIASFLTLHRFYLIFLYQLLMFHFAFIVIRLVL